MTLPSDYLVRRLRLRHLELLVALADAGTMRGAAARLSLSQPAISKMLKEIEEGLEARLFERSHQGMHANEFGVAAAYRARVILSELARTKDDIGAIRGGATSILRIGAPSVTSTVPAAVVQLRSRMPGLFVKIREGRVSELIQRLLDGELDCVFAAITPELLSGDQLPLLRSEVVLADELCVLASKSNKAVRRRNLRWSHLHDAQWVAPPKETLVRQALSTAFLNGRASAAGAGDRGSFVGHHRRRDAHGRRTCLRGPHRARARRSPARRSDSGLGPADDLRSPPSGCSRAAAWSGNRWRCRNSRAPSGLSAQAQRQGRRASAPRSQPPEPGAYAGSRRANSASIASQPRCAKAASYTGKSVTIQPCAAPS